MVNVPVICFTPSFLASSVVKSALRTVAATVTLRPFGSASTPVAAVASAAGSRPMPSTDAMIFGLPFAMVMSAFFGCFRPSPLICFAAAATSLSAFSLGCNVPSAGTNDSPAAIIAGVSSNEPDDPVLTVMPEASAALPTPAATSSASEVVISGSTLLTTASMLVAARNPDATASAVWGCCTASPGFASARSMAVLRTVSAAFNGTVSARSARAATAAVRVAASRVTTAGWSPPPVSTVTMWAGCQLRPAPAPATLAE